MFGIPCPECGKGTIEPVRFQNYKTKVKAYPFVVPEVIVGVCDTCNARAFDPRETKRWRDLFYQRKDGC